ncbi:MAG: hypothetical protein Q8L55_04195 [Phycisphaerales bacterium]|nr:hypothetical protein [Phycisphaerales bacterium]
MTSQDQNPPPLPGPVPVDAPPIVGGPLPPPQSNAAVASMVLGIVSCVTFCMCYGVVTIPCGILAIVFARQAGTDIAAGRAAPASAGMARAGRVCGIVGLCITVVYHIILIGFMIFAVATDLAASNR